MSRLDKFGWEEIREERGRVVEYYLCWKHIVKESTLLGCFVWIKDADYLCYYKMLGSCQTLLSYIWIVKSISHVALIVGTSVHHLPSVPH